MHFSSIFLALCVGAEPLPNTQALDDKDDLAMKMVTGIDKYLMRELTASVAKRKQYWKPDFSSPEALRQVGRAKPPAAQRLTWSRNSQSPSADPAPA